jgi:23S rRNA pseudouridine1911/1915/1917 synthase
MNDTAFVSPELAGLRLDQALPRLFPRYSRSQLKGWLDQGLIQVNQKRWRGKDKVIGGETVDVQVPETPAVDWAPEPLPLTKVFEDEHILVLNKPKNQVVHPGAGNATGTMVNAILHDYPHLAQLPRGGIVHRLDKDTTGIMVVAKSLEAHHALTEALQMRTIKRLYEAVVWGVPVSGATINLPLGRHPIDRKKRAVLDSNKGKPAITHYRIQTKFRQHALLEVQLETGRTHQIRVHLAHTHYPIVGDKTYGGRLRFPAKASAELQDMLRTFPRQALHAKQLTLQHPISGETMTWTVPRPFDMEQLIKVLAQDQETNEF